MNKLKLNKKLLFSIQLIVLLVFGFIFKVSALSTININKNFVGLYHTSVTKDGKNNNSARVNEFSTTDGKVSYCIAPGEAFYPDRPYNLMNGTNYSSLAQLINATTKKENNQVTPEEVKLIELYAHYGYGYPGHNTLEWRIATQALIWRTQDPSLVFTKNLCYYDDTDCQYLTDAEAGIADEIEEIIRLVDNHDSTPSFKETIVNFNLGDSITLTDNDNVLSNFRVAECTNCSAIINGNNLTIYSSNVGNIDLKLVKTDNDVYNSPTFFATSGENQNQIVQGTVDPIIVNVTGFVTGGRISITKYDADTKACLTNGDGSLIGAKYAIYDESGDEVDKLTIGNDCTATSKLLGLATYSIKEIESPIGYIKDNSVKKVTITNENVSVPLNVTFYEEPIKLNINLYKIMSNGSNGLTSPEKNAKFEVYLTSKNELVGTMTTDENGIAGIELPFGTYTIKQISGAYGHYLSDPVNVTLHEKDESIYINNKEITAKLKVIKVDSKTGKVIKKSNIKFRIKNVETGKYVEQLVTYPKAEKISIFETDQNGILITPYPLKSGTYRLEEVDQEINGYLWNNKYIEFTIDDDTNFYADKDYGNLVLINFSNTQVKGEVDITKYGEKVVIEDGKYHYEEIKLDGVVYELYAYEDIISGDGSLVYKKNELIGTYETRDGCLKVSDLYLGKYYFLEKTTIGSHILDTTKHVFELEYKDQYTPVIQLSLTYKNYLGKSEFKFTKTDLVTGEPLPNTKIQIFTNNDNEERQLIFEGYTNEFGEIIIKDLFVSKFVLFESEAPEGYILNLEPMEFEVTKDGEIIKCIMTDEKIEIDIPITNSEDYIIPVSVILIIFATGVVIYDKIKKNK